VSAIQDEFQAQVKSRLLMHSIASKGGIKGPTCQTGQDYIELIIRASSFKALVSAVVGAVTEFGGRDWTCYWRVDPEIDLDEHNGNRAYLRFCVTNLPELPREQAA
jgi:hypothetical protein